MKKWLYIIIGFLLFIYGVFLIYWFKEDLLYMVENLNSITSIAKFFAPIVAMYIGIYLFSHGLNQESNDGYTNKAIIVLLFGTIISSQLIYLSPQTLGAANANFVILNTLGIIILIFCLAASIIYSLISTHKKI